MNYSIIPKNNFNINLCLKLTNEKIIPYISYSLIFYLNDVYNQLFKLEDTINTNDPKINEVTIEYVNKIVNPFEFIHTNVPGSIISVSKVKPDANIFFELMEIFQLFNINEILSTKHKINIAHLTPNYTSTNYLLNMLREESDDNIISEDFDYNKLHNMFLTNKFEKKLEENLEMPVSELLDYCLASTNQALNRTQNGFKMTGKVWKISPNSLVCNEKNILLTLVAKGSLAVEK